MITKSFVLLAALAALAAPLAQQAELPDFSVPEAAVIDLAEARRAFGEIRFLSALDGKKLWGETLAGPVMFVDLATRRVAANQPAFEETVLELDDGVYTGTLPDEVPIANTAMTWAGTEWTMLIWPLPRDRYARQRLLVHECFHRIQDDIGLPMSNPANGHLDGRDGRTWLRLEWRALTEALMRRGKERRSAIEDAVIFRAHRRELIPAAAGEERALELNEGLAEYTGLKLCGWPEHTLATRAAVALERADPGDSFTRSFAYASGPAYGLLLDDVRPDWREGLTPASDLGELLRAAHAIELPDYLPSRAVQRARRHDGEHVITMERQRAERREIRLAAIRSRFIESPVLVLALGDGMRYSFDPNATEALDEHSTVYSPTTVRDAWGSLEVNSGGALLIRSAAGAMVEARVPAPTDTDARPLTGDGWILRLGAGYEVVAGEREGDVTIRSTR